MISVSPADDQFIEKLNEVIRARMSDPQFSVPELARKMGMSRSTLHRRMREVTGKPIKSLISEARLDKAMNLLNEGKGNVSEVAWETGFGSPTYFIKRFKEHFGFPPGEAKKKVVLGNGHENGTTFNNNANPYTKSEKKAKQPDWIKLGIVITSFLFFAMIVFLLAKDYFAQKGLFEWIKGKNIQEKSIAILPFINDSPDTTNIYFINGVMEGITDELAHISDLKVTSRISAEKFRKDNARTIRQIARQLGVNLIVEGSGQKIGDDVLITVQLIEASSDKHLLSKQYSRKYEEIGQLF